MRRAITAVLGIVGTCCLLVAWGGVVLVARWVPVGERTNCLLWALARWQQHGGYVVFRRSDFGWWPHLLRSEDLVTFEEFTPTKAKRPRRLPPLIFTGRVRTFTPPEHS